MIEQLKNAFGVQRTLNCFSKDDRIHFYIAENDATSQSYIVPLSEEPLLDTDKCWVIKNPDNHEINHVSIDACLLTEQHGYTDRKCDFVAFSDDKFCFVELKSNAYSQNRVRANLNSAIEQLGQTINHFDDNGIDFSLYDLEAYIVFKNHLYPTNSASIQQRKIQFYNDYEVELIESSEVEF